MERTFISEEELMSKQTPKGGWTKSQTPRMGRALAATIRLESVASATRHSLRLDRGSPRV
jgi:hypothetical protein